MLTFYPVHQTQYDSFHYVTEFVDRSFEVRIASAPADHSACRFDGSGACRVHHWVLLIGEFLSLGLEERSWLMTGARE